MFEIAIIVSKLRLVQIIKNTYRTLTLLPLTPFTSRWRGGGASVNFIEENF